MSNTSLVITIEQYLADKKLQKSVQDLCTDVAWLGHDAPVEFTDLSALVRCLRYIAFEAVPAVGLSNRERAEFAACKTRAESLLHRFATT